MICVFLEMSPHPQGLIFHEEVQVRLLGLNHNFDN